MSKKGLPKFKDILIENLQDSEVAKAYLAVALEEYEKDKEIAPLLLALMDILEAQEMQKKFKLESEKNKNDC